MAPGSSNINHLLQRLSQGDRTAFDAIFYDNYDIVYSAALVMTRSPDIASDIAQDVFLSLWENRQKIEAVENLQGFLYVSVKYKIHKRLRRMKVENAYTRYLSSKTSGSITTEESESMLDAHQLQHSIQEGIAQLPPQQQRVFKLSREQGLTHEQISDLIGISKASVKDYIVRSLAFLRQHLAQHLRFLFILFFSNL